MTAIRIETAHTSAIDPQVLEAARALLDEAFEGRFDAHDWDHSIGGMHVLVWDEGDLIGHGSVVQRRLLHGGRALRCGYVEAVAVRADRRRRGHGAAVMAAIEDIIRGAYDLGALAASEAALDFYRARDWQPWAGPTSVLTPAGLERTEDDDGAIFVLPVAAPLDLTAALTCDWRDGDLW